MFPKEHGGWAMLLLPYIIGLGVAGRIGLESLLFLLGILFVFMASEPLGVLAKVWRSKGRGERPRLGPALRWLSLYLCAAGLATVLLVVLYGRWWLILFGALGLAFLGLQGLLESRRMDRTVSGELVGAVGLALSAPGVYYATLGELEPMALFLWLLTALHSAGSVLYINLRLRHYIARGKCASLGERLALGKDTIAYLVILAAVLSGLNYLGHLPLLALVAFLPLFYKVARGIYRASPRFSFKRLGYFELANSVLFAALLVLSYTLN